MKRLLSLILSLALVCFAHAQGPTSMNAGLGISSGSAAGIFNISWWGVAGNSYFIQTSDDLATGVWTYVPISELGSNQVISWGFSATSQKFFARLQIDSDGSLLPDEWQNGYFGYTGVDPNTFAQGIPGLTFLQCFQQGLNPIDYYNEIPPNLTIVSGGNQTGISGVFLTAPLIVQVTDTTGNLLINAPVTFSVTQGNGLLAPDASGTWTGLSSLAVRTGSDGNAQIYFLPMGAALTSMVSAFADNSEADFSETTIPDTNPPVAPSNLSAVMESDGSALISWQDNSDNETGFTIQQSNDGGVTWSTVASVGAGTTFYQFYPTSNFPIINGTTLFQINAISPYGNSSSNGASGGTATANVVTTANRGNNGMPPGLTPVPATNYAVIDLDSMSFANPVEINDSLQILDYEDNPWVNWIFRVWSNGQFYQMPQSNGLAGANWWNGLSNTGKIVCSTTTAYAYSWSPSDGLVQLQPYPGSMYTRFVSIKSAGNILGQCGANDYYMDDWSAYIQWYPGANYPTVIADIVSGHYPYPDDWEGVANWSSGGIQLAGCDENRSGSIAGLYYKYPGGYNTFNFNFPFPVLWNNGTITQLSSDFNATPVSINNLPSPVVVGNSVGYINGEINPYLWCQNNGMWEEENIYSWDPVAKTSTPLYGNSYKINDRGEIIGDFGFWQNGSVVDLETRVSGYNNIWPIDINNNGVILASAYDDDTESPHNVLLTPVLLTNKADPTIRNGANGKDITIQFLQSSSDTNINAVAWIAANDPNNNNAPRMPQLQATVGGTNGMSGFTYCWKLKVTFHDRNSNPHRDFDTGDPNNTNTSPYLITGTDAYGNMLYSGSTPDVVTIPAPSNSQDPNAQNGWVQVTGSSSWNIYQSPDWTTGTSQGFFGGDAVLSLKILDSSSNTIMPEQDYNFRIAGENSVPQLCQNNIASVYGGPNPPTRDPNNPNAWQGFWFADAIAQEETGGEGQLGTTVGDPIGNNHLYHQFLFDGGRTSAVQGKEGTPDWHDDGINVYRKTGSGGYGLFQLTYQSGQTNYIMPRDWIWNWQSNVKAVGTEWQETLTEGQNLYNGLIATYPGSGPIPPYEHFSGLEAIVITYYNGMNGKTQKPPIPVNGYANNQGSCWYPISNSWQFRPNKNGYVDNVNGYVGNTPK